MSTCCTCISCQEMKMFVYISGTVCLTCVLRAAARNCAVPVMKLTQLPVRTKESYWVHGGSSSVVVRYHRVDLKKHGLLVNISQERTLSLFPALPCSANSTYSPCMTSCPASCSNLAAPSDCETTSCIEGCQCGAGFVMSEGACVPYKECGCTFLERYYPVR